MDNVVGDLGMSEFKNKKVGETRHQLLPFH